MTTGRHVEVLHRHLTGKPKMRHEIDDDLYTITGALMSDSPQGGATDLLEDR